MWAAGRDMLRTYGVMARFHLEKSAAGVPLPRLSSDEHVARTQHRGSSDQMPSMLDMQAMQAYTAGTMKKKRIQYTIRNVPERTDVLLRESAVEYGRSLNEVALTALQRGIGSDAEPVEYHDLDELIGSWVHDDACDKALDEMDRIDPELWS